MHGVRARGTRYFVFLGAVSPSIEPTTLCLFWARHARVQGWHVGIVLLQAGICVIVHAGPEPDAARAGAHRGARFAQPQLCQTLTMTIAPLYTSHVRRRAHDSHRYSSEATYRVYITCKSSI